MRNPGPRSRGVSAILLVGLLAAACAGGTASSGGAPAAAKPAATANSAAPAPSTSSAPAAAPEPIKTTAAYTTISVSAATWWVALDAGYFREQGLDVDLKRVDPGATLLAAMRNGELEYVFSGGPTLVLGYIQGLETMIVGSTSNVLDAIIFTRPEIQRPEDLRGKVIGVSRLKAITDVAARLGLERVGLKPDVDVQTRGTGGNAESLAAMETGAVDGASLNVPVVFEAQKRGYRNLIDVTSLGIQFASSGVGATKKVINERPELGERYLRALAQANSRLKTDREAVIPIVMKYTQVDDRELVGQSVDFYRPLFAIDPYPEREAVQTVIDVEENPGARGLRPEEVTEYRFADALRRSGFLDTLPR